MNSILLVIATLCQSGQLYGEARACQRKLIACIEQKNFHVMFIEFKEQQAYLAECVLENK